MVDTTKQYPKFLAFLQLFYPTLYKNLSPCSSKADIVEANLICSNTIHSFQAIVFSEGLNKDGEILDIYTGANSIAPYSWDWRWVFAIKILYQGNIIFPIKFKQKVIALPTGNHPLSNIFFNALRNEFQKPISDLINLTKSQQFLIQKVYANYCASISI